MNEHVSTSHPDWHGDFRAFDRQLRRAPLLVLANPTTPGSSLPCATASTAPVPPAEGETPGRLSPRWDLVAHAKQRGRVALHDGQIVTLLGVERRARDEHGDHFTGRARIQTATGDRRTIGIPEIAYTIKEPTP